MIRQCLAVVLATFISFTSFAQQGSYKTAKFKSSKISKFDPQDHDPGFAPKLKHKEAPTPGGDSYRSFLMKVKAESAKRFPRRSVQGSKNATNNADSLLRLRSLGMNRYVPARDTLVPVDPPGAPLDNTLAINNRGLLLGSVNSLLYAYDLNADTIMFDVVGRDYIELDDFASPLSTSNPFDPKLLFDPQEERFILVFLSGRSSNPNANDRSEIIVGFSTSDNPLDPWNVYSITGTPYFGDQDPAVNNTWTDYPAVALTNDELFITINLLRQGEPWQTGFAGSIIWQVDKYSGYEGADSLDLRLYGDIRYNGRLIRNLNPIQGGKEIMGPNMYLLSNRNFDVQNDSIFVLEVTNTMDNPETTLDIRVGITETPYGVPPNGEQENASPVTDSTGFDTNDGRILGGFLHEGEIQFVANTKEFESGRAAVYHGFIQNLTEGDLSITGNVIADPQLDFGYPNIAYAGKAGCDREAVIGFNHTSADVYAGFSAIYYSNFGEYSPIMRLKNGLNYVDDIQGPYERWGDYFGIQRVYNEPGKVWTAGFFGNITRRSATWFSELQSPDSNILSLSTSITEVNTMDSRNRCDGLVSYTYGGGQEPYTITFNGEPVSDNSYIINLCEGDYTFEITDKQGCVVTSRNFYEIEEVQEYALFPNPTTGDISLNLELIKDMEVQIRIHDLSGKLIMELLDQKVIKGFNTFSFSTLPLSQGSYILSVYSDDTEILTEKILKN